MGRSAAQTAKLTSTLWAALGYFAKKRTVRESLPEPGGDTPIDVRIVGTVGRSKIDEQLRCKLSIGPPQPRADVSAAKPGEVIAYLLSRFEEKDRHAIAAELQSGWTKSETVPQVSDQIAEEAKQMMAELRTKRTKTVAGSITAALVD